MKNILIIGGCGYIGSALYMHLRGSGHTVDTIDLEWFGNFSNPDNIKVDFGLTYSYILDSYDVVILVAANSSVPLCKDIHDTFNNNVVKFVQLVGKLKKQKFIYASSSCVYVTSDATPKIETDSLSPLDGLTLTKTTIDNFMSLTDVEYYGLRFGSVNGWAPNMRLDLMINAMTISALNHGVVNVFNGHAHRPILSVYDLCRSVEAIVDCTKDNRGVYNVASVNHNILEIGKTVAEHIGVRMQDNGKNFTYDFTISSQKFKDTFDFNFVDSIETIVETIIDHDFNPNWTKRESK